MAQVIPPITSLPLDSSAAPSVEDIQDRIPSMCVDYLSHNWSEEDVWASWRSMTRHKHEIANGVRLENASWRTWQKQRNKLKTISPETLNWLKDSDVTWLYGPLHTAQVEPVRPPKVANTEERLNIDLPAGKKPILKHRTLSEMLSLTTPSSPILEATYEEMDVDVLDGPDVRPPLMQTKSDTNIVRQRGGLRKSPPRHPIVDRTMEGYGNDAQPAPNPDSSTSKRHISFNTFVEQCVAVDDPNDLPQSAIQFGGQQDDSDDDVLEMRSMSSGSSRSRPSLSRGSSTTSVEHLTIAKIAPTMLKTGGHFGKNSPAVVYMPPPEYRSPSQQTSPSYDFPSPEDDGRPQWGDQYGTSAGYDYFGSTSPSGKVHTGGYAQPRPPTQPAPPPVNVAAPPAQPKWRQPAGASATPPLVGSERSSATASATSSTGSSSSSLTNVAQVSVSPPQPQRSILKVRSPQPAVGPAPESPPLSYFNYNPSVATGIGGMRSAQQGVAHEHLGPTGSPVTSPVVSTAQAAAEERPERQERGREERGRSTSRGNSALGRSSSGSQSIGSTSSLSPGTPRSPMDHGHVHHGPSATVPPPSGKRLDRVLEDEPMDVDGEDDEASEAQTPTPHSSPQIAFRPMKDTSPASLPHTSTRLQSAAQPSHNSPYSPTSAYFLGAALGGANGNGTAYKEVDQDLPTADPATVLSPTDRPQGKMRPTTAHVGTNAAPTLAQPMPGGFGQTTSGSSTSSNGGRDAAAFGDGVAADGTIISRAANIASTAKDILGALWYGANEGQGRRVSGGQSAQVAQGGLQLDNGAASPGRGAQR